MLRGSTHLSIGQWAEIIGLPPTDVVGMVACSDDDARCKRNEIVWSESDPRGSRFTREALLREIQRAEHEIAAWLGFWPSPRTLRETLRYPYRVNGTYTPNGSLKRMQTSYRFLHTLGTPTRTPIASDHDDAVTAPITVVVNGDRWTATVTLASVPASGEWLVYPTADHLDSLPQFAFPLRPVTVAVDGTTITLSGETWTLYDPVKAMSVACCDAECQLTEIELWHLTYPDCDSGVLRWYGTACDGTSCDTDEQTVCWQLDDRQQGYVRPQELQCDGTRLRMAATPTEAVLTYRAGLPLEADGRVQRRYADAVAFLAASRLPGVIPQATNCDNCANARLERLREIPRFKRGEGSAGYVDDTYTMVVNPSDMAGMPFARPTLGAILAWKAMQQLENQPNTEVSDYV